MNYFLVHRPDPKVEGDILEVAADAATADKLAFRHQDNKGKGVEITVVARKEGADGLAAAKAELLGANKANESKGSAIDCPVCDETHEPPSCPVEADAVKVVEG